MVRGKPGRYATLRRNTSPPILSQATTGPRGRGKRRRKGELSASWLLETGKRPLTREEVLSEVKKKSNGAEGEGGQRSKQKKVFAGGSPCAAMRGQMLASIKRTMSLGFKVRPGAKKNIRVKWKKKKRGETERDLDAPDVRDAEKKRNAWAARLERNLAKDQCLA